MTLSVTLKSHIELNKIIFPSLSLSIPEEKREDIAAAAALALCLRQIKRPDELETILSERITDDPDSVLSILNEKERWTQIIMPILLSHPALRRPATPYPL